MNKIKILVMDVDGTLTDGKIYMGENGELFKAFDAKDGLGINMILPQHDIMPIVLTGRKSKIVENRCSELNITHIIQGSKNKEEELTRLLQELQVDYSMVAYIGDDVADYGAMKKCAVKRCPNDAVKEIREISDCVTDAKGGAGAVREFIEWIVSRENS